MVHTFYKRNEPTILNTTIQSIIKRFTLFKKFSILIMIILLSMFFVVCRPAKKTTTQSGNFVRINHGETREHILFKAANVVPSPRQYTWQKMEFIAFVHFGMNTFMDREWGEGDYDISLFNPTELDARQWAKVCKDAGMKMIIMTAKHHDGFCLWPSKYTTHTIQNTPYRNGKGDLARELSQACQEAGLKFGVYLSPWDRHEPTYGDSPVYNEFFRNQLTELLTNYGEIAEVWFDGACGEGPNGKRQVYDWHSYYQLIRKLQPNAVIAIMGPDVRWVGTESGYGRETEWSVLPGSNLNFDQIAASSQQQPVDGAFIPGDLTAEDLGSREKHQNASSLIWYPAENDVSIRPGWFYHQHEDTRVKTPAKLMDIYYSSVGRNAVLLLNLPPDRRGLIHENDVQALKGMRHLLDETFKTNFVESASVIASNSRQGHCANFIIDQDEDSYWTTDDGIDSAWIEFHLSKEQSFDCAMLQENILVGQRIEKFRLDYWTENKWHEFVGATTVGYKRLLRFPLITANKIRFVIEKSRTSPTLAAVGLFKAPPEVNFEPESGSFVDSLQVQLLCDAKNSTIYYALDGSPITEKSSIYSQPITLNQTTIITALAVSADGKKSLPVSVQYNKARYGILLKSKFNHRYAAGGVLALIDGAQGSPGFDDGRWQGYEGTDLDAVIDLGKVRNLQRISTGFIQNINSWIFMPNSVKYTVSADGKNYTYIGEVKNDISEKEEKPTIKSYELKTQNISARYVRVIAKNRAICPDWHTGAGSKAWIFADEIVVE